MIANRKYFAAAVVIILLITPSLVFAKGLVPCGGDGEPDCNICYLGTLVINVTKFLTINIAIPLAVLMIVIGGMMLLISGGSEGRVKMGKTLITNAIIGMVIVYVAWILIDTIIKVLINDFSAKNLIGFLTPWYQLPNDPGNCPL